MQRFLTFSCSLEVIYCSLGYSGRVIASEQCWPWSLTREVHSKKGRDKQLLVLALHQLYMRTPTLLERGLACLLFQLTLSQSCTIFKLSGSLSYFRWAHLPVALVIIIFKLNILSFILTAIRDFSFEFFTCLFFRVIGQYTIRTE